MAKHRSSIRVAELFAGVGGFRVGLGRASDRFHVVFSNQWEPSTRRQDASDIYVARFGNEGHHNSDIAALPTEEIPDHDLLVGGYPCQDYSVARTLNQAAGLEGRKGVLWWQIHRILKEKKQPPAYLMLENVDRLLKSPAQQRGRDFAIMLASLADLGYAVEWRVINAADYGMPQRRRRVFFLGYHRRTTLGRALLAAKDPLDWLLHDGVFAAAFPADAKGPAPLKPFAIKGDLAEVSARFNRSAGRSVSPFHNAGILRGREVWTLDTRPVFSGPFTCLADVLQAPKEVPASYAIPRAQLAQWKYLKGAKSAERVNKASGKAYRYSEGAMTFPDALDRPARTIVTGEGGATPSRFKHVVKDQKGRLRRLTPVELERLNMFPDGHTDGASATRRAFLMGNALVTGIVERLGKELLTRLDAGATAAKVRTARKAARS
ncbi:MAG: DNA (cytosine-5-)-methyltransferase [Flavobacteriales bacterium]|nr:DNA (cytosine-5-)-methyltransferase [Flavobacteriales bacterium]